MKIRSVFQFFTLLAAFLALPFVAEAQQSLRASCSQDGRIVFREDLPANAGANEKMLVSARFPEAVCVFVPIEDSPGTEADLRPTIDTPAMQTGPGDDDLATALALISSGQQSNQPGEPLPIDLSAAMQAFRRSEPIVGLPDNTINLTIGIYVNMRSEDVLEHWKLMQRDSTTLKKLTPTLTKTNDITMLSVEYVPDALANAVCTEAAQHGSGCLAYY